MTKKIQVGVGWWLLFWFPGGVATLLLGFLFVVVLREIDGSGTGTMLAPFDLILMTIPILGVPIIGWFRVPLIMRTPPRSFPWPDVGMAVFGILMYGSIAILAIAYGDSGAQRGTLVVASSPLLALQLLALVQILRAHESTKE